MTDDLPTVSVGLVAGRALSASLIVPADVATGTQDTADLIPIDAVRRAREIENARKARRAKMVGNCGKGIKEPCGMLDQEACRMHGPLLPEIK